MHRLTDRDLVAKTANCAQCGPVSIRPDTKCGRIYWRCTTLINADKRRFKARQWEKKLDWDKGTHEWLLAVQDTCMLCNTPFQDNRALSPAIDHCPNTGVFRGLLHVTCNMGLGLLGDTHESLLLATEYLRPSS